MVPIASATQHAAACFIMGFDGIAVTPHIRCLIADQGLAAILITEKNIVGKQAQRVLMVDRIFS